jgi:hypothetical protein
MPKKFNDAFSQDSTLTTGRRYYLRNREQILQKRKRTRQQSSTEWRKRQVDNTREWRKTTSFQFEKKLKHTYGLTLDQYHAMYERQDFLCAICREEKPLVVDHCHFTQKNRGLLCVSCNAGIGMFYESVQKLESAIDYVKKVNDAR